MLLDLNKQRVDSEVVELFEIVIDSTTVRFTNHPTNVRFSERNSPFVIREYIALPLYFSGYEQKAEGAYSRPTITFANVLSTFKTETSNNDLIGKRLIRRKTLAKYLATGDIDENPPNPSVPAPIEMPIQVFIIDRIESENAQAITFELTSGFDLQGISVPNRYIVSNTCTWLYQGIALGNTTVGKSGGCTWKLDNTVGDPPFTVRYDSSDRPIITGAVNNTLTSLIGQSVTADTVYKIAVPSTSLFDYYQALLTTTSSTSASFRRCRLINRGDWVTGNSYATYSRGKIYNDIVTHANKVWVAVSPSTGVVPGTDEFIWERIDICGKKLTSCAIRYKAVNFTGQSYSVAKASKQDENKVLPYGGFPGAKRFNR